MPELDGFAATAQIRQHEGDQRRTLIVAMTASAMQGDRERCLAAGMDDYVSKPITLDVLREKLALWLPEEPVVTSDVVETTDREATLQLPDALDRQVLETVREVLEDLFPETIEMFLHETSARLDGIQKALVQQDLQTMSQIAHTMKGSSGNIGALRLSELCQQLMSVSETGVLADTTLQVVQIATEFMRVCAALGPLCHVGAIETTTARVQ